MKTVKKTAKKLSAPAFNDELVNYREEHKRTLREWEKFTNSGGQPDRAVIPDEILESWIRCKNYGVNPKITTINNVRRETG